MNNSETVIARSPIGRRGNPFQFMDCFVATLLAMTILLTLSSCSNFRPLYGQDEALAKELSRIEIQEIDTINGAELYHNLSRLLASGEDTKYSLQITLLSDNISPLAITGHANVVKQNIAQQYEYSLVDKTSGKTLDKGKIRAVGSYDTLSAPYAAYTKEKTLKKNLSQIGAEEIYMRLMLYFSSK
jgi:hypothetical protein